jgi:hypothetical protein
LAASPVSVTASWGGRMVRSGSVVDDATLFWAKYVKRKIDTANDTRRKRSRVRTERSDEVTEQ